MKLLVIGAGWEQYDLIKAIKDKGHCIIATHPVMNTDGFKLADVSYVRDSRDIKAHFNIAETHEVDAIVSDNCDYSFYTATIVASKLKLPFAEIQSGIYSNDKYEQRLKCSGGDIKQPVYRKVKTLKDVYEAAGLISYPLVIKPIDSRGTIGVTVVYDRQGLEDAYYDAIDNSYKRMLICEKFIEGNLITVDGFCFKNGHKSLTVASQKFDKGPKPVTKEVIYPAEFNDHLKRQLMTMHNEVVSLLRYHYGHTHGEYILTEENDIYFLECTNRGGGVFTSSVILPELTGINLSEILLNQSLGIDDFEPEDLSIDFMKKSILLTFFDFEVGKVIKGINVGELRELPYLIKFRTIYSENDMVEPIDNCPGRHSMIVIQGKDVRDTLANFNDFKSKFDIRYY